MTDSACACGFSTNDLAEFEKHVQQHEDTFAPKLDLQNLMKTQPSLMQNLPAVAANIFSNYCESSPLAHLFNKVPSGTANFLNNNVFNNGGMTRRNLEAFFKDLPVSQVKVEQPLVDQNEIGLSTKKSSKSLEKKEGKPKKVTHSCPHCNFETVMSQHMKSHLEAHERHQGQMYICDVCSMQFSQKANMHRHRMRHSGVKPYECKFCKKRFFRKDQMQEHSMTHLKTGEDFDCPVANCDSHFRQHSALRSHLDEQHTITANEQAACKRCAMTFSNSRRLLLHYQTKHDDGDANTFIETKRDQSVLSEYSDEDANSEVQAKRPHLTPTGASTSSNLSSSSGTPRNDPLDLSSFSSGFGKPANSTDFLLSAFNWNTLRLPLSVNVPQPQSLPISLEDPFSPQHLPKSKPPTCENLFQSLANTSLNTSFNGSNLTAALNNTNVSKILEQSSQQQLWSQQQAENNTAEDHDHSSTHSPTSDSLTNSTIAFNEAEDKNLDVVDHMHSSEENHPVDLKQEEKAKQVEDAKQLNFFNKFDCKHCRIQFNESIFFLFHQTLHSSESNPWTCGLCGLECGDQLSFTTHIVQDQHSPKSKTED